MAMTNISYKKSGGLVQHLVHHLVRLVYFPNSQLTRVISVKPLNQEWQASLLECLVTLNVNQFNLKKLLTGRFQICFVFNFLHLKMSRGIDQNQSGLGGGHYSCIYSIHNSGHFSSLAYSISLLSHLPLGSLQTASL